ncbi:MAG TPA: DUF2255 family protein [Pyrinomonadaceae bacterium]|nr:DUF2255 family protein [Pyrinomonadaceae bacterium]
MPKDARFADDVLEALRDAKIFGVRAGAGHRYTGVWGVVVEGRFFVRSWNDKPTGWFRAFRREPSGSLQVGALELPVRGRLARSARLRREVTAALGRKYDTKASRKWVEGFAEPERELTTLELVPR